MDQATTYTTTTEESARSSDLRSTESPRILLNAPQIQQPVEGASMKKVNEVYATAALAFQRLSELVLQIHSAPVNSEEQKWSAADAEYLANSMKRFSDDCEELSKRLRTRTGNQIKTDFKRRTILINNQQITSSQGIGVQAPPNVTTHHYNGTIAGTSTSGITYTVGANKRPAQTIIAGVPPKRILGGSMFRSVTGPTGTGVIRQRIIGGQSTSSVRVLQPGQAAQRYYEQMDNTVTVSPAVTRTGNAGQTAASGQQY
uniref:Uncharacterized protein n=1 Tax=Panagrolaimus sp. JU765 TaxID=591449 RepID=A0AC34Q2P2_9BILA